MFWTILSLISFLLMVLLALRCSQYRYDSKALSRLIDRVKIGSFKYRYKDGVILKANKGFMDILELGMNPKDVLGKSLGELIIYVEGERTIREKVKQRGELRNYEYHFKTLKGKDKWVLHNSYLVRDPYTGEEAIETIVQDITEEVMSYDRMKQSQERYEKLFVNSGDMVFIYKANGAVIEEINPVTEVITGFSAQELVGRTFDGLFHPSSRSKLKQAQEDLLFKGSAQLEAVIVCRNGTYREVFLTLSVVELKDERRALVIAKDISELVKGMDEQKRRKAELEEFWKAAVEREERIKDLRHELDKAQHELKALKGGS